MAKKGYIGIDGVARKIKKGYIGIDGVARKIKKAYIGIGGVARPCWSGGELTNYGTISGLDAANEWGAATSTRNHAFFAGSHYRSENNTVTVYDTNLVRNTSCTLEEPRHNLAATTIADFALFGGGAEPYSNSGNKQVNVFDDNLTHSMADPFSEYKTKLAATTIADFALFSGGYASVEVYDKNLTHTIATSLSENKKELAAASNGYYALFAGGNDSSGYPTKTVDAYDTELTRTTPEPLVQDAGYGLASATIGSYALIGNYRINVYDENLTRTEITSLSGGREGLAATTIEGFALFGGGDSGISGYQAEDDVYVYDDNLTQIKVLSLSIARAWLSATTVGNYALFGGGCNNSGSQRTTVDVFTVN